jgi:Flp pilus assembly protein TadD
MAALEFANSTSGCKPAFRFLAAAVFSLTSGGCASLKHMTEDFDRRWDDPTSIMAEMESGADKNRALQTDETVALKQKYGACAPATPEPDRGASISLGECLLQIGKNQQAQIVFSELSVEDEGAAPEIDRANVLQGLGIAELKLDNMKAASTALEGAVALNVELWRAWNALGVVKEDAGDVDGALSAFELAADLNPNDGAPVNNFGVALLKAGRYDEAIEAFSVALEISGAKEAAEANMRLAFSLKGDYAAATRSLPDDRRSVAYNNAGFAAASRGDKDEARRLFQKALDESPHFYAKAYNNLTLLLD